MYEYYNSNVMFNSVYKSESWFYIFKKKLKRGGYYKENGLKLKIFV